MTEDEQKAYDEYMLEDWLAEQASMKPLLGFSGDSGKYDTSEEQAYYDKREGL